MSNLTYIRPAAMASMAAVHSHASPTDYRKDEIIAEGWVLKKRRKKMQGFARRYFTLHQSGILSYSFEPGHPPRDQILLPQAAISTAPGRKDIHVDSSNATFHMKCLSVQDFNQWITAFRKYIVSDNATIGRKSSMSKSLPRAGYYSRANALADEMGVTLTELHAAFAALVEEEGKRKPGSSKGKEHTREHAGPVLSLFKHRKSSNNVHSPSHDASISEDSHSGGPSRSPPLMPIQRLQTALDAMKYQHSALAQSLSAHSHLDMSSSLRASPLPTAREDEETVTPKSAFSTLGRSSHRLSSQSEASIWYDAQEYDGAEEFVLEEPPPDDSQASQCSDGPHIESTSSGNGASSHVESDSESETDSDEEGALSAETRTETGVLSDPNPSQEQVIVRRTQLPSPVVGDEGSLFAVLKKNVGKDLAQVALPVSFNEPLTLLQRLAEELEYHDLLVQAVACKDPGERFCFVAAFAVSGYANTRHRSGRKGFNPMLSETFEDSRMCFIAEKVSHNPVVLAYHAEGDGWELYATSSGKTKFWGKSLEIIPQGSTHLVIGEDHYEWNKPSSFMRNLMLGTKYLEHCGKTTIHNTSTGARCVLEFKESGYWGPSNQVSGTVFSAEGKTISHLEGKWDEQMSQKLDEQHFRVLWRMTPFPRSASEYYGFTSFGITLNEITPDLNGPLPPTDSRLRPDVRALEEGDIDLAEVEKVRVEELQRERRKGGKERKPRWFKKVGEEWQYTGGYWEQRVQGWKDIEPLW